MYNNQSYNCFLTQWQILLSALPRILEGSWIYNLNYWRPENLLNYLPIFALAFACQT